MECIAHRGFAAVNPENTLTAVRDAAQAGADAIELDIRQCGSGELVVVHDTDVDRVTGASGRVDTLSAAALEDRSVLGSGDGIPTLEAVCREISPGVELVLDVKEHGIAQRAVETARGHDCEVLLSSESAAVLAEAELEVPRAYIFDDAPELMLKEARDLGCTAVHPHWHLCTDSFLAAASEFGFAVNAWTVTSRTVAADLAAVGVDGLITDAPDYCGSAR